MKKALYVVGGLVVLLIVAALVAPSFVDVNRYKPEITAAVKQATGRDLTIGGDIELTILPSPAVISGL